MLKIYTYVRIMPETVIRLCQYTGLVVNRLLLLPWCKAIAGYCISSNNSNNQQLAATGYRQTSKSRSGVSSQTQVKTITNTIIYA